MMPSDCHLPSESKVSSSHAGRISAGGPPRERIPRCARLCQSLAFARRRFGVAALVAGMVVTAVAQEPAKKQAPVALDLLQENTQDYAQPEEPTLVTVEEAQYLMREGKGEPGGEEFVQAVGAIYAVAYGLQGLRASAGQPFQVAPLEALWWGSGERFEFLDEPRESWNWRVLIRVPAFVGEEDLRKVAPPNSMIRLKTLLEGPSVQVLHRGPYSEEPATIAAMTAFAEEHGYVPSAPHHEIYLTDPNRTPPEKMRTILRQPVKEASAE